LAGGVPKNFEPSPQKIGGRKNSKKNSQKCLATSSVRSRNFIKIGNAVFEQFRKEHLWVISDGAPKV
jgi:hypothetical protein